MHIYQTATNVLCPQVWIFNLNYRLLFQPNVTSKTKNTWILVLFGETWWSGLTQENLRYKLWIYFELKPPSILNLNHSDFVEAEL